MVYPVHCSSSIQFDMAAAQLSLSHGGLGLCSVSHHSSAAYIASLCSSGFANRDHKHLARAVDSFNRIVSPSKIVTVASILAS